VVIPRGRLLLGRLLGAALLLALLSAAPVGAATLQVTKLGDSLDGACDADCSLREAIARANLDGTEDVIVLPAGVLVLTLGDATDPEDSNATGDLDVTRDVVLRGAGAGMTTLQASLPAGKPDRVLDVLGSGTDLELRDLTVTGGRGSLYGGGIRAGGDGELALERVIVRDNEVSGQAALGYGGGIYKATGRLSVRDSALYRNRAVAPGYGGGIFLNSPATTATLTNVTVTENSAGGIGGAIASNNSISAELTHLTIVGNEAGQRDGGLGLDVSDFRLRSSVVARNTAPTDPDCGTSGFAPASDGGNVGSASCGLTQPSDAQTADPRLGPFGGPGIPVLEPLSGSPALDRAVGLCPPADARGVARPQGLACDAGAAELPVSSLPTPPAADNARPPAADTARPAISRASLTRTRFRVARAPTPVSAQRRRRAPAGTVFRYTLSEPAAVTLTIQRASAGRRARGSCRRPSRRLRSRPACTRWLRAGSTISRQGATGANRLAFSGRIGRKALPPGRYRGLLRATDPAGNRSADVSLRFRVVRR
jgi:CSLREA domain-containing protein